MDNRPLVRVATAGSVDDGKSTFIGRLLYDCQAILDDQYEAVVRASHQTGEERVNLALLTDGLRDERSQKITIDVAYRHFATPRRRFLLADTPGHAQYTRNMFTGASTADIAILLVDAERGPTVQTRRHAFLTSLLRVPHVVIAINKMDRVDYSEDVFLQRVEDLRATTSKLEFADLRFVPISALEGDHVARRSDAMSWYQGPTVLSYLDEVELSPRSTPVEFRFPIQCAIRPDQTFRGFAGQAVSGAIRVGEEVVAQPGGQVSQVRAIHGLDGPQEMASLNEPVVLELAEEIDASRGTVLSRVKNPAEVVTDLDVTLCWMGEQPMQRGKVYRMLHGTSDVPCVLKDLLYKIDPETLHREPRAMVEKNEIGRVQLRTGQPIPMDTYAHNRAMGAFLLVESDTHDVAAAGVITSSVREPGPVEVSEGPVLWLTGLSGAGKSTISDRVAQMLRERRIPVIQLDGDQLRAGLNRDLGFSAEDRNENVRRVSEIARLLSVQGTVVICSLISPMREQRRMAREVIGGAFLEVFVDASIEVLRERDPKGLYARAFQGEIRDFTGVSAPYEAPETPALRLRTDEFDVQVCASKCVDIILEKMGHR